jgi:hypothetical protein
MRFSHKSDGYKFSVPENMRMVLACYWAMLVSRDDSFILGDLDLWEVPRIPTAKLEKTKNMIFPQF